MNLKRKVLQQKYEQFFKMDLEQEKVKILEKGKPPRAPLSPYIFFSQETRIKIKKEQ